MIVHAVNSKSRVDLGNIECINFQSDYNKKRFTLLTLTTQLFHMIIAQFVLSYLWPIIQVSKFSSHKTILFLLLLLTILCKETMWMNRMHANQS